MWDQHGDSEEIFRGIQTALESLGYRPYSRRVPTQLLKAGFREPAKIYSPPVGTRDYVSVRYVRERSLFEMEKHPALLISNEYSEPEYNINVADLLRELVLKLPCLRLSLGVSAQRRYVEIIPFGG
jgi:hypothetical protein